MKKILLFFSFIPSYLAAQNKPLVAEGVSPSLFITHKVEAKENFYSIGRIYNISPREIAPFNNLQLENGLSLGQVLRIPLSSSNFFQSGTAEADETFVPLYHVVSTKEGLYRIATNYNDLPLETLREWNSIKGDVVKNGTKLIVGYLKVKKDLSYLARNGIGTVINAKATPIVKTEDNNQVKNVPSKTVTTEEANTPPVNKTDVIVATKNTDTDRKTVMEEVKKEPAKKIKETESNATRATESNGKNIKGGAFKSLFETQVKNTSTIDEEGVLGVFKSTSGWKDGKYYCLYNNATPGTIIKVTIPGNDKFIYAKVLDIMPDLKQNAGLLILISNAAADELGVTENNYSCSISYSK